MIRPQARKRQLDRNKQKRKMQIVKNTWHEPELLENNPKYVGHLVKGKIHCSCPICAAKTNPKRGTLEHGWKHSDKKKLIKISNELLDEYKDAYLELAK